MISKSGRLKFLAFCSIGIFNTLFDIVLYVWVLNLSHNLILANILSTTAALLGSYFLNSRYTFRSKSWTVRSFAGFAAVTLFGLWILQTTIIYSLSRWLSHSSATSWGHMAGLHIAIEQVLPKLIATMVTFVWNYLWYNKVIFKPSQHDEASRLAFSDL